MRKTQPPSTTRAIFSDVRAAEDIKQLFFPRQSGAAHRVLRDRCSAGFIHRQIKPANKQLRQLQICITLLSTKAQKLRIIQQIMIDEPSDI